MNDGRRAPALLTSQLTKELVTLKDDLIAKTELADVLSTKVGRSEGWWAGCQWGGCIGLPREFRFGGVPDRHLGCAGLF